MMRSSRSAGARSACSVDLVAAPQRQRRDRLRVDVAEELELPLSSRGWRAFADDQRAVGRRRRAASMNRATQRKQTAATNAIRNGPTI